MSINRFFLVFISLYFSKMHFCAMKPKFLFWIDLSGIINCKHLSCALGTTTFSITTLSTTTFSIMTLKGLMCDTQYKWHSALQHCHYAECRFAECRILFIILMSDVMLNVIMLSIVILSVTMLSVVMLSEVAPCLLTSIVMTCFGNISLHEGVLKL